MNRRGFLRRFIVSSALVVTGASAVYELVTRLESGQQQQSVQTIPQQTSQTAQGSSSIGSSIQPPSGYVFITPIGAPSGNTSAYFSHPTLGTSLLVSVSGQWKAFGATCTHQPCTVQYNGSSSIRCPCHGATFSTGDGSVLAGPAPRPLPEYEVQVDSNGDLFVTASTIN